MDIIIISAWTDIINQFFPIFTAPGVHVMFVGSKKSSNAVNLFTYLVIGGHLLCRMQ